MKNSILKDKLFWLLLIFASIYILGNIGTGSLSTWDEAIYANISKNILKTGDWLILQEQGRPWFDKPPLYMWLTAIFYKVFGVNEFATRLTSSLFGIAAILLMYIYAKKISNRTTAIFAAMILLAMPHFLHFSKLGMMDVVITFFILLMIYLFWIGQQKPHYLFFSGAVLGIAYLIKGFAVFLAPIIILVYCVLSKNLDHLIKPEFIIGILFSVAIIFLWHLSQYFLIGPEAIKHYFGFHIFQRATQAIEYHQGGINFYQKAIFNKNKPWSILIYVSVFYILWQAIKHKDKRAILLCCWIATTYAVYTAVKTKLHWYIMPVYPALALSSAIFLEKLGQIQKIGTDTQFLLTSRGLKIRYLSLILEKLGICPNFFLVVILIIMLAQVPVSWAFKIDFCPDTKKAASYAKELHNDGSTIYFYGAYDNKEVFYLGHFSQFFSKENIPSKSMVTFKKVYCVIKLDDIRRAEEECGYIFQPVKYFGDIAVTKIRSK